MSFYEIPYHQIVCCALSCWPAMQSPGNIFPPKTTTSNPCHTKTAPTLRFCQFIQALYLDNNEAYSNKHPYTVIPQEVPACASGHAVFPRHWAWWEHPRGQGTLGVRRQPHSKRHHRPLILVMPEARVQGVGLSLGTIGVCLTAIVYLVHDLYDT